jgi:hypothetical protein
MNTMPFLGEYLSLDCLTISIKPTSYWETLVKGVYMTMKYNISLQFRHPQLDRRLSHYKRSFVVCKI